MESHDSKNEIKWRKNSVCLHIMNLRIFFLSLADEKLPSESKSEKQ